MCAANARSFLVLSSLTTVVKGFLSGSGSMYPLNFQIGAFTNIESCIQHHNQKYILSSVCRRISTVLNGPPPVFALFCLQLALWWNRDVGPKRVFTTVNTPQHIDQMIYFKAFGRFIQLQSLLWVGLFLPHLI